MSWRYSGTRRRRGYWASVGRLIGHLVGTVVIFGSFFTLGWLLSVLLHFLNSKHRFPTPIFEFITKIELWIIYADFALCGVVLIAGAYRFVSELVEADF